jgi:hypothetical protein
MNCQDVTDITDFVVHLDISRDLFKNALARKGEVPVPIAPQEEMLHWFKYHVKDRAREAKDGESPMNAVYVVPPFPPCVKPLAELQKIMLSELLLETRHQDRYALLRSVSPSDKMSGINTVVEDESGKMMTLIMFNLLANTPADINQVIREGMVFAIKNPYLQLQRNGDHTLRIDQVSDYMELPIHDERVPVAWRKVPADEETGASWKAKGNDYFKASRFGDAIDW